MRFGRWDEVLRHPAPPREWLYTSGVWRYARGMAFNAKGQAADAQRELRELEALLQGVPPERTIAFCFRATSVLQLAANVLAGEMAAKAGDIATAERLLRAAVAEQDTHWFTEPPSWYFPVRQALGERQTIPSSRQIPAHGRHLRAVRQYATERARERRLSGPP